MAKQSPGSLNKLAVNGSKAAMVALEIKDWLDRRHDTLKLLDKDQDDHSQN